ncbi:MAG: ABC transporter ATP-binding protein [Planctomycetota bacterium]
MLAARDLTFAFGPRQAVRRVGLTVESGSRVAIVGPNGSGKSTLLRLLGGHLSPTSGSVLLGASPVSALPPKRRARHIAIVPQALSLAFPFSVARFVAFGRHALDRSTSEEAVRDALDRVSLASRADDPVGELSQGQQQRASIARALCQLSGMPPGDRYLLADEPTASLDPAHALPVQALFRELADDGVAVVAALHDLAAASDFSSVLLMGANGVPVAQGVPDSVLTDQPLRDAFGVAFRHHRDESGRTVAICPTARDVHSRT